MIPTRFGLESSWPTHKQVPIFKKCFFNLVSLKTGSKVISLLWILLFAILFFVELRTAFDESSDEQLRMSCMFNTTHSQSSKSLCPTNVQSEGVFLYGYYRFVINETQGSVVGVVKIDDGLYEWNIFCICLFYSMLILFCSLLYMGIIYNKASFILTWLGLSQMILILVVCKVTFDFIFLIKNDQYLEYLSFQFLLHLGFVGFTLHSLLIVNSYVVSSADTGNLKSMVG
ncbi:hypothetical protein WDU94_014917 [Cyamophila willieti]